MNRSLLDIFSRFPKALLTTGVAIGMVTQPVTAPAAPAPSGALGTQGSTTTSQPNILYIVADDLGYSDLHAFGGEINTPNLDLLVQNGRILTNFHVSTVSAVTRSMMYTGVDHHLIGEGTMGAPMDERSGLPGYEGYLNDRAVSIGQLLRDGGYHPYIVGKWHLGSTATTQTPDAWGFEHSYVLLGGATSNHFGHEALGSRNYTCDGQYVQPGQASQPAGCETPIAAQGGVFYDTDFYTQQIIKYIDGGLTLSDGKPFAAFVEYTSPHWPLQVTDSYRNKYAGKYDVGYDAIRAARLARLATLGISHQIAANPGVPDQITAPPGVTGANPKYISAVHPKDDTYTAYGAGQPDPKWSSMTANQQKLYARYMEIYAGMVENLDNNVGLIIQHLKDTGQYNNTLIIFHADNGAEGWPLSATQDTNNFNQLSHLGNDLTSAICSPTCNVQYGLRWAEVSASPFKLFKGYTSEGGVSAPTIIKLPGQTAALPILRTYFHITDMVPTLLDYAGVTPPATAAPALYQSGEIGQSGALVAKVATADQILTGSSLPSINVNQGKVVYDDPVAHKTKYVYGIQGLSMRKFLENKALGVLHTGPVGEEQYGRTYLYHEPWKAIWLDPNWGGRADGQWMLFNMNSDRGETNDVSGANPAIIQQLYNEWKVYMNNSFAEEPLHPVGYY